MSGSGFFEAVTSTRVGPASSGTNDAAYTPDRTAVTFASCCRSPSSSKLVFVVYRTEGVAAGMQPAGPQTSEAGFPKRSMASISNSIGTPVGCSVMFSAVPCTR